MTHKTNTLSSSPAVTEAAVNVSVALQQTLQDFKNAVLIVSVAINLFALTTWLAIHIAGL